MRGCAGWLATGGILVPAPPGVRLWCRLKHRCKATLVLTGPHGVSTGPSWVREHRSQIPTRRSYIRHPQSQIPDPGSHGLHPLKRGGHTAKSNAKFINPGTRVLPVSQVPWCRTLSLDPQSTRRSPLECILAHSNPLSQCLKRRPEKVFLGGVHH